MLQKKNGGKPIYEIECLRVSKETGQRKSDKSNSNEKLKFTTVKGDLIVETQFYIYRISMGSILEMLIKIKVISFRFFNFLLIRDFNRR